jgi:hypothetical protein
LGTFPKTRLFPVVPQRLRIFRRIFLFACEMTVWCHVNVVNLLWGTGRSSGGTAREQF